MLFLCGGFAFAQNPLVKGSVSDENGRPLLGISVQLKGSTVGVATNEAGYYEEGGFQRIMNVE